MTCDSVTGSVTELNLVFNYLTGTIPTEIGNLQALVELDLEGNDLTGAIPTPSYAPQPQPPLVLQKYTTAFTIFLAFFIWC